MPLHHTLACDPPTSRRFRRCAPLLLAVALTAGALAPGLIAGDRPFQAGACGDLVQTPEGCAPVMASAPVSDGAARVAEPGPEVP